MPTQLTSKSNNKHAFSLRANILVIFITLFVSAILTLVIFNYFYSSKILLNVASTLMQKSSASVKAELFEQLYDVGELSSATAQSIQEEILNVKQPQVIEYTAGILNKFPIIDAAWLGDTKGNFVLAETEEDGTITSEVFNRAVKPATRTLYYRNHQDTIIKKVNSTDLSYDPRNMFWYHQAIAAKKLVWTDIYVINVLNRPNHNIAIIAASPVYKKNGDLLGVFGLDMTLNYLTRFIEKQKIGEHGITYIVRSDGKLISLPGLKQQGSLVDIHDIDKPWLIKSYDMFKKTGIENFTFTYKNEKYLASYTSIPHFLKHGWIIGLVVPENDFIGELKKVSIMNTILGLGILMIGVWLISNLATRVVSPMNELLVQTDRIKNFELDNEALIHSRIKEINSLSEAIFSMQLGLKSFQQYVPATLVRQLIETGEHARIGGTKKKLTIFFSDIENFTTVSEQMDPNKLMEHICEYFDEMSKILIEEKCTIDKYIGDSVMGFWGAPLAVDMPCERGANAALRCLARISELNIKWKKVGKPELISRIGLNMGDAIVGNVGSAERLNYTAIGDSINLASRLEGLNKIYGTHIIVSRAVYDELKNNFVLRKLDEVIVKGKTTSDEIYELLAKNKKDVPFDIDKYRDVFEKGFAAYKDQNWKEAMKYFKSCLEIYPADTLAVVFISRIESEL